jgi:uncharacterized membrane protein (DUF4010 family)
MTTQADVALLLRLLLALAIGLLIGLERGWRARAAIDETRVAGWRSFTLLGVLGGVSTLLAPPWTLLLIVALVAIFFAIAYALDIIFDRHWSITTGLAAILTVLLGALAMGRYGMHAVATTVIVAILLAARDQMHGVLRQITPEDLQSTLRFLLIALVILPWLPNRGFGPYGVFNPFELWSVVVLVSGLSFIGYIAMRLLGKSRGIFLTAAAGGLVSSTAVTLALSRLARAQTADTRLLSAGIILACTIMPLRMMVLLAVLDRPLLAASWPMLAAAALTLLLAALVQWRRSTHEKSPDYVSKNPLDIGGAIIMTVGIALIMLLARVIEAQMGKEMLVPLGALTGMVDVDAMLVAITALPDAHAPLVIARQAILAGALANSLMKAAVALVIAPLSLSRPVVFALILSILVGATGFLL